MNKVYHFVAKRIDLALVLTYKEGIIQAIELIHNELTQEHYKGAIGIIPFTNEIFLLNENERANTVFFKTFDYASNSQPLKANEKIALWKNLYKEIIGTDYKISPKEIGKLSNDKAIVTSEQIRFFLKTDLWWASTKNVNSFLDKINDINREMQPKMEKEKSKHPNGYDKEYENKLSQDTKALESYWKHLRSLGLSRVQTGAGTYIWRKKNE